MPTWRQESRVEQPRFWATQCWSAWQTELLRHAYVASAVSPFEASNLSDKKRWGTNAPTIFVPTNLLYSYLVYS